MAFVFSGRSSDISYSTTKSFEIEHVLGAVLCNNNEIKVLAQKLMLLVPDRNDFETCFFHAFFLFLATRGAISSINDPTQGFFMFPGFQKDGAASTKVTEILRKYADELEFLDSTITSKTFRYGAITEIYTARDGGSEVAAAHGGWMADENVKGAMCEYLVCLSTMISRGARILGGYEDCRSNYKLPRLVFLENATLETETQIERYLNLILHLEEHHETLKPKGKSFLFIKTTFAVFLMHLENVKL
jgi:hypothetical protein